MSADNWGICPKCKKQADDDFAKKVADVGKKYGKVPSDEYLALVKTIQKQPELEPTLREDYEFSTDEDAEFIASYYCSCSTCGFGHSFKHKATINLNSKPN